MWSLKFENVLETILFNLLSNFKHSFSQLAESKFCLSCSMMTISHVFAACWQASAIGLHPWPLILVLILITEKLQLSRLLLGLDWSAFCDVVDSFQTFSMSVSDIYRAVTLWSTFHAMVYRLLTGTVFRTEASTTVIYFAKISAEFCYGRYLTMQVPTIGPWTLSYSNLSGWIVASIIVYRISCCSLRLSSPLLTDPVAVKWKTPTVLSSIHSDGLEFLSSYVAHQTAWYLPPLIRLCNKGGLLLVLMYLMMFSLFDVETSRGFS